MRRDPLPSRLQQILDRAMAKDPRDRYQKMEEMRNDLRGVLQEVTNAASGGAPVETIAPEPPRHVASVNPVSRAMRWIRRIWQVRKPDVVPEFHNLHENRRFTKLPLRRLPTRRRRAGNLAIQKYQQRRGFRVFTSFTR